MLPLPWKSRLITASSVRKLANPRRRLILLTILHLPLISVGPICQLTTVQLPVMVVARRVTSRMSVVHSLSTRLPYQLLRSWPWPLVLTMRKSLFGLVPRDHGNSGRQFLYIHLLYPPFILFILDLHSTVK